MVGTNTDNRTVNYRLRISGISRHTGTGGNVRIYPRLSSSRLFECWDTLACEGKEDQNGPAEFVASSKLTFRTRTRIDQPKYPSYATALVSRARRSLPPLLAPVHGKIGSTWHTLVDIPYSPVR